MPRSGSQTTGKPAAADDRRWAAVLARDKAAEFRRRGILINAACPGLIDTEASRPWFDDMSSAATPDEAAKDVIWLATLPAGTTEPYGELVRHRKPRAWK